MSPVKRWNPFDAAAVAILASVVAVGVAGYRRFQVPEPEIWSVVPAHVVAGTGRPLSVRGRYFHPYLHTFVFASGQAPAVDAIDPARQEAKAVATTATQLDVTLPPVTPGVHDLYLFNEFQQVAFLPRAFTVDAPVYARAEMIATVRFYVATGSLRLLVPGDRDRSTSSDPSVPGTEGAVVTAVRTDPAEHPQLEMRIASAAAGGGAVWIGSRAMQQQVDLELRVPLVKDASDEWRYNGAVLRAGQYLEIETARFRGRGMLIAVSDPEPVETQVVRP